MKPSPEPPARPVIPDHQLIRLIGEGSYGEIWLAKNVIGTYRAVKIVYRAKFEDARPYDREFKGIRKFEPISRSHPGLVQVLQVGRNDDAGYFYYVMELADDEVAGREFHPDTYSAKTLGKVLARHDRLPAIESLQIGMNLAAALAHMHKQELVHRDIKPSNIIFVQGQPKLADIGLVVPVTEARTFVGTEGYIPPEGPGTIQADIYSLGKVLYEISTGQDRQSFPELPDELDTFEDRELVMELNEVVVKACANSPQTRYDNAEELRRDLEILIAGRSVKRLHFVERQLARVRRVAVGAIVVALAAAAFAYWLNRIHQREKQLLADAYVSEGARLVEDKNLHAALPFFAEALRIEERDPAADTHRLRIGAALQQSPKLLQWFDHESAALDVRFSADGERLLIAGGRLARLVNIASGASVREFRTEDAIENAAFSPDGMHIAIASGHVITVGNIASGTNLFQLKTNAHVYSAEFSPDGKEIIVASDKEYAFVIDAQTGDALYRLPAHHVAIRAASFSPDGAMIVTASEDGTACVWSRKTQELIVTLRHPPWIYDAAFSPDGRRVVTASADHTLRIFDVPSGYAVAARMEHLGGIRRARFSPDGRLVVSAGLDETVRFWDAQTGKPALSTINLHAPAMSAAFSPEARRAATTGHNGKIKVWDIWPDAPVNAGNGIVSTGGDRYVTFASNSFRVWNAHDDSPTTPLLATPLPIASVLCSADGQTVVALCESKAGDDATVHVNVRGSPLQVFNVPGPLAECALSPDGTTLLTTCKHTASLWNTARGELLFAPKDYLHRIAHAVFSPNNRSLAMSAEQMLFVLDTRSGTELFPPREHKINVGTISFAPDSSRIITGTSDAEFTPSSAHVWDAHTGKSVIVVSRHSDGIVDARFSRDGRFAATAGDDGRAAIWHAATGAPCIEPLAMPWQVQSVSFSANNRWLLATTWFEAQVWNVHSGRAVTPPFSASPIFKSGGFCASDKRIWVQSRQGLLFWKLPRSEGGPDEIIALAEQLGATVPGDLRWNRDALPLAKLREHCTSELARCHRTTESWHREQAQSCEQAKDWFAAQFHLEQLLKRTPNDPSIRARLQVVKSHLSASASAAVAP